MEPFVGEIRIFCFDFAPVGWAQCNGQMMQISQNQALYAMLYNRFGGNGSTTFALPNLQGRIPVNMGQGSGLSNYLLASSGGQQSVALAASQIPAHTHSVQSSSSSGNTDNPTGNIWAKAHTGKTSIKMYSSNTTSTTAMSTAAFGPAGSSTPHNNIPPYLVANFCIALEGIFPSQY